MASTASDTRQRLIEDEIREASAALAGFGGASYSPDAGGYALTIFGQTVRYLTPIQLRDTLLAFGQAAQVAQRRLFRIEALGGSDPACVLTPNAVETNDGTVVDLISRTSITPSPDDAFPSPNPVL